MKIIGDKVRQARLIRGMPITELSEKLGVTKQAVFQYENDLAEPKNETLFKLVSTLDFPLRFFTIDFKNKIEQNNTFFRARLSANKIDKMSWGEQAKFVTMFYEFLNEYLSLPEQKIPVIDNEILEEKNYDRIASLVRDEWEIKNVPIKNMVNLLESNGIIVSTIKSVKTIDAFTQTYEKRKLFCVVIEDTKNSMVRRNFSLAHELAHILMHYYINFYELDKEKKNLLEREADKFAAALLLPNEFNKDLLYPNDLDFYIELKQKWFVSIFAMIMRAKDLGRIDEKTYISLIF